MTGFDVVAAALPPLVRTVPAGVGGSSLSVQNLISVVATIFSGGTLVALLRVLVIWKKTKDVGEVALKKATAEGDSSLRSDLLRLLAETRTDHANQIADIRKEQAKERKDCEDRLHSMQQQIDGLVRQLVAFQVSSARAIGPTPATDAAIESVIREMNKRAAGEE